MFNALAIGALTASLVFPIGGAPAVVPTDKVVVDLVTLNGTGCPAGSTAVAIAPDNTAFTVTYSKFTAQAGPNIATTEMRKNCQASVWVHVPSGFSYAVTSVDYRGYANLAKGATATQRANYYFQGYSQTLYTSHSYNGPLADDWQTNDTTDVPITSYSPCGEQRYLNINTELRVSAGSSNTTSFISMDSMDGSIKTTYHFTWLKCPVK